MRTLLPLATLTGLLAAAPTFAATITQLLPAVQNAPDLTPFSITGAAFDPGLGTLTSVTGELTGTVTANIFRFLGPFQATRETTSYSVFTPDNGRPGPNTFAGSLADQTVTPTVNAGGGRFVGAPTAVDLTFDFGNLSAFITPAPAFPTGTLAEFGFVAGLPDLPAASGGSSDATTFNGTLRLTYTYAGLAVPEPGSVALLGSAIAGLLTLRRRTA